MKAKKDGVTLVQPRAGVGLIENHIELLKHLQDEGGADLLSSTIDSYTRQNQYENCAEGIRREKESMASGKFHPYLNGFVQSRAHKVLLQTQNVHQIADLRLGRTNCTDPAAVLDCMNLRNFSIYCFIKIEHRRPSYFEDRTAVKPVPNAFVLLYVGKPNGSGFKKLTSYLVKNLHNSFIIS